MEDFEISQGKTVGDLGREAMWFLIHTLIAVLVLLVVVAVFWAAQVDPDASGPKILCTVLALLAPAIVGLIIAKVRHDVTASYVWISGLLTFLVVCVWVLDLPTGPGLCEKCGAISKLTRTFFEINNGSGLMGGDGVLVGMWVPLSMVGYAIGAKLGLDS